MRFPVTLQWLIISVSLGINAPVAAQPISPADNSTDTTVNQSGTQFDIGGGTLSGDIKNLFHDFERFGLEPGQIANFLSQPNIENILGRVSGGETSIINGLLQVSGGNSNLYLMNPAGILFGENASLNVTGDFTATTATGIGLGANWFSAFGENDYVNLVGTPTQFLFNLDNPQAIINGGNLSVLEGQSLNLFAGNVESTGNLQAKSGQINIQAIADKNTIQLFQDGSLLNLEINATELGDGFSAENLPELLTGVGEAKISGVIDVSGEIGGEVKILGESISLENATIDASGINGGGNIFVGGDKKGLGDLLTAQNLFVDENTNLTARAIANGDGGQIIVFSEDTANISGSLIARGGEISGDGGFIETSALKSLQLSSQIDAGATNGVGGEWLIDPTDITIEAGAGGSLTGNTVGADLISNALNTGTSITLDTSSGALGLGSDDGNILMEGLAEIRKSAGGEATLRLNAENNIRLGGEVISTSDKLNIILNADRDGSQAGSILLTENASLQSNGGNIILGGGSDPETMPAYGEDIRRKGVALGATLNSGTGNISIRGVGKDAAAEEDNDGIDLIGATLISTGDGLIVLDGVAGTGSNGSQGIRLNSSSIQVEDGTVTLTGTATTGNAGRTNNGISLVAGSQIQASGSGQIILTGIGGDGTDVPSLSNNNDGIYLSDATITSVSGDILFTGTAQENFGTLSNRGVALDDFSTVQSVDGDISLDGTGNFGVAVVRPSRPSTIETTGTGAIAITGISNSNTNTQPGVLIAEGQILTNDGDITVFGQGSDNTTLDQNQGIRINRNSLIESTGLGSISLEGIAGEGRNLNDGIFVDGSKINSTGTGAIALDGTGQSERGKGVVLENGSEIFSRVGEISLIGQGSLNTSATDDNYGIYIQESSEILSSETADITLTGTGGIGEDRNYGIYLHDTSNITSQGMGEIFLTGTGGSGARFNNGILVDQNSAIAATTGSISLTGFGGAGLNDNDGIAISSSTIRSSDGYISLFGQGNSSSTGIENIGVLVVTSVIESSGSGSIELNGTGGNGTNDNDGIKLLLSAEIKTLDGDIRLVGKGSPSASGVSNDGVLLLSSSIESTQSGLITLDGTAGSGTNFNDGVVIESSSNLRSYDGNINILGRSNTAANGVSNGGIEILSSSIESLNNASIGLFGDEINLDTGSTIFGNQNLVLEPFTPTQAIALNGTTNNDLLTLELTATDLDAFQNGFAQITIGRSNSSGEISLADNVSFSDPVLLRSPVGSGEIDTNGFDITGTGNSSISLLANQNVTTENITTQGRAINLISQNGVVTTEDLTTSGNTGGDIFVDAELAINSGKIDTSGSTGNGGDVTLDPISDVVVESINAQGGFAGVGGTVDITAGRYFRATDTFIAQNGQNASIATIGGLGNGSVTIRHGGQGLVPFQIGRPNLNGTAGTITSGDFSFVPFESFLFSETRGNLRLISVAPIPALDIFDILLPSFELDFDYPVLKIQVGVNPILQDELVFVPLSKLNIKANSSQTEILVAKADNAFTKSFSDYFASGEKAASAPDASSNSAAIANSSATNPNPGNSGTTFDSGDLGAIANNSSPTNSNTINSNTNNSGAISETTDISNDSEAIADNASPINSSTINSDTNVSDSEAIADNAVPANSETLSSGTAASESSVATGAVESSDTGAIADNSSPINSNAINSDTNVSDSEAIAETSDSSTSETAQNEISDNNESNENTALSPNGTALQTNNTSASENSETASSQSGAVANTSEDEGMSVAEAQNQLKKVQDATGITPAILHAIFVPTEGGLENKDQLQLILTPPEGDALIYRIDVTREEIYKGAGDLQRTVTTQRFPNAYKTPSKKLHQWLIEPLTADLELLGIEHLALSVDQGLRSMPWAVLNDGNRFLIENYSLSLMPSLALTNLEYTDIRNLEVLAMGANTFSDADPLPAVPIELDIVSNIVWEGKAYLNEEFSTENLKMIREEVPYRLVHLATHGEFKQGLPSDSFIRFGEQKLGLNELRELGLHKPPVELMVLSACRTAIGDYEAELGFAGLAVMAGVKSAMGSLWYVSDEGTLGLIAEFYQQLGNQPIKSEALRQTQLAMLRGDIKLKDGDLLTSDQSFPLTDELKGFGDRQLSHPYYWSSFVMIGNPW